MFLLNFIKSPKARYILGLVFLLGVVLLWVGSGFLTSYLFQDQSFNRPFFLTYFNTSCFSLYLVIVYSTRLINFFAGKKTTQVENATSPLLMEKRTNPEPSYVDQKKFDIEENENETGRRREKFTDFETAKLGLQFCILWFIANYASNLSYVYTSVASSTILSSTSGVFTLFLGYFFKTEKFTKIKLIGVAVSLAGVVIIALLDSQSSDTSGENHSWKGDLIALLGSLFYGFYISFLKLKVDDELVDPQLFLGFVGLSNLIILIPIFFIVHYTGFEAFSFPPNGTIWGILFVGALLGTVLSDYLWLYSVMLTSPLVTTLGLSFTIPISIIGEIIIHNVRPSVYYYIGAVLVILGFFGVNSIAWKEFRKRGSSPSNNEDTSSQITAADNNK